MKGIMILENNIVEDYKKNCYSNLAIEKCIVEANFSWLFFTHNDKSLQAVGTLKIGEKDYAIELIYSPLFFYRFDRIYVKNQKIVYNKKVHLYRDLSLCLYHPILDKPFGRIIPLVSMIPWITEWCIHYEEWKKYGVWLGREIIH